eukprot:4727287-Amphidinium_carterae.1
MATGQDSRGTSALGTDKVVLNPLALMRALATLALMAMALPQSLPMRVCNRLGKIPLCTIPLCASFSSDSFVILGCSSGLGFPGRGL